jgi:NADPH:quinone reductase-like Zn-dependent oxidoreductase
MKVARILQFGSPEVIQDTDVPRPLPGRGQVLVHVKAAGAGPWNALIREGKSVVSQPFPITLGSDLSGTIESVGFSNFKVGDEIFGVTNE